ncbi:MAG: histidine kinase dimerization/phosphoacceptor domain -containing protein [Euryarchaeota archaeon]|nr:histidine kinase dimerization/phosphoacceptor domain -containing protein [Euryarchaeota archaeon]
MLLKSDKLVVAELSALYEISSIQFLQSEQDILNEATQKAIRLFGVRFFLVHANGDVVTSWGFRDSKKISKKIQEAKSNQFKYSFQNLGDLQLFMEQSKDMNYRERRLYTMFAKSLENALFNAMNIKKREEAEKALIESESRYRSIFEHTGTATMIIEEDKTISLVNSGFENLSGYSKEEIENKMKWTEFVEGTDLEKMERYHSLRRKDTEQAPLNYEFCLIDRNKNKKNVFVTVTRIIGTNKSLASIIDITARKDAENKLKKSLNEKEMLLKEIHHRVKNNLMVISSLLNLQSRHIKDKAALDVFRESQNRADSMALIHERLYGSTDLKRIDFGDYISTLSTQLFHTYVTDPRRIKLKLNVENLMVDINTTVPLGLILNELVTNSIKYAFPEGKSGEIKIEFNKKDDEFILIVSDNGVGFPKNIDFRETDSLGLQLVNNLTSQINGKVELNVKNGTEFTIKFREYSGN